MEYRYRLTKAECLSYIVTRNLKRRGIGKRIINTIVMIGVCGTLLSNLRFDVGDSVELACGITILLVNIYSIFAGYMGLCRRSGLGDAIVEIEGNKLKVGGAEYSEAELKDISIAWENNSIIVLQYVMPDSAVLDILLPQRLFHGEWEKQYFLTLIAENHVQERDIISKTEEPEKQYTFFMNAVGLTHMIECTDEIKKSMRKRTIPAWLVASIVTFLLLLVAGFLLKPGAFLRFAVLLLVIYITILLPKKKKALVKEIQEDDRYSNLLGIWTVKFYDEKIVFEKDGRSLITRWYEIKRLIHIGGQYFFCYADGSFIISVPQCVFESYNDEEEFITYCVRHGLRYEQLKSQLPLLEAKEYDLLQEPKVENQPISIEKYKKSLNIQNIVIAVSIVTIVGLMIFTYLKI